MRQILAILAVVLSATTAFAADVQTAPRQTSARPEIWRFDRQPDRLPFARTSRSQAVYASDACWSECQAYCSWGQSTCLKTDPQGLCLKYTDRCDRTCQSDCRSRGGPFVSLELPWD